MKLKGKTFGETLGPAMDITDQAEADDYLEQLVTQHMERSEESPTHEEARAIVLQNLGYYAGYYARKTQERVNRLFRTTHPVFGDSQPTAKEAFEAGARLGRRHK